jgi:dihydrofolate synthase/folylpolyglutamate synthase
VTYPEVLKYLESFINYEKIPVYPYKESCKLERVKGLLDLIGNPQHKLRCVHVAGSKGKGSTCSFAAYILRACGFQVGLYTSPHLNDFRERIRVLSYQASAFSRQCDFEGMITEQELTGIVTEYKAVFDDYCSKSEYGPLSFFEVYTTIAFIYYLRKNVDFVVLETGLGGRLDATNTVYSLVSVITPISYEHTQKLGNTLGEIAYEKAGIIKGIKESRGPIVICAPQEKEVTEVIKKKCQDTGSRLYRVGEDILYGHKAGKLWIKGIFGEYHDLEIKLAGEHQLMNAVTAVAAVEALHFLGIHSRPECIREGLKNTSWPGRCEVVSRKPLVVLDGAHNEASARALRETLLNNFKFKRVISVIGMSNDKDIAGFCRELDKISDIVILTKADNPRAVEPNELSLFFRTQHKFIASDLRSARLEVINNAAQEDLVIITGSLFLVGEARVLSWAS